MLADASKDARQEIVDMIAASKARQLERDASDVQHLHLMMEDARYALKGLDFSASSVRDQDAFNTSRLLNSDMMLKHLAETTKLVEQYKGRIETA